ncbi:MAG TPA: dual specificity protein phosphatase [Patescibacteria group bacterium]|nr:dual specificity protein phosphatase [Patescibacteria group bacterium]
MSDTVHPHTIDYSMITPNIYIGSDLCRGSYCPIHGEDFKKLGVCAEINLKAESKEIPPDEINIYAWLPVKDKEAPSYDQLKIGSAIIYEAVSNGNIIYVHCSQGHGRSPTMVASYFIRYQKMSVADAILGISKKRPEVHIEDVQKEELEKFKAKLSVVNI